MKLSVNFSPSVPIIQRNLSNASHALEKALERMSTGFKLNSAKDNAAGMYIATMLNSQIRGLKVANKNVQDGAAVLNIAENSLTSMNKMLQRIRDLALQSANGVYGSEEKKAIQNEINNLLDEIVRTKTSTEYNGKNLFGAMKVLDKNKTYTDISQSVPAAAAILSSTEPANILKSNNTYSLLSAKDPPIPANETGEITLKANETKTFTVGDKSYTLLNTGIRERTFKYIYDLDSTNLTITQGQDISITSKEGQDNNIKIKTAYVSYYGSSGKDIVTVDGSYNNVDTRGGDDEINITFGHGNVGNNIYGGDGNDILRSDSASNYLNGGNGNDLLYAGYEGILLEDGEGNNRFELNGSRCNAIGGSGNDEFIVNNWNCLVDGKEGTNTLIGDMNTSSLNITGQADKYANSGAVIFKPGEEKTITRFGQTFILKNNNTNQSTVSYSFNNGLLSLTLSNFEITTPDGQNANLKLTNCTNSFLNLGNGNNTLIVNGNSSRNIINTANGSNNITLSGDSKENTIQGGAANDTINIETSDNYIVEGTGSNTIKISANAENNLIDERNSHTNTIIDLSSSTGIINSPLHEKAVKQATISLTPGQSTEAFADGKTYTISNTSTDRTVYFKYGVNNQGQVVFNNPTSNLGKIIEITSKEGQTNNIVLTGSNSAVTYNGSNQKDKILVDMGGCTINANDGDNEITTTSNAGNSQINTGNGNDRVILNSNGEGTIKTGGGDDYIESNGGTIYSIEGGDGNDTVVLNKAPGDNGGIHLGDGNDTIYINADDSKKGIHGDDGDDTFFINGNNNQNIQGGNHNDTMILNGNWNKVNGGYGDDTFINYGNNNTIADTGGYNTFIENNTDSILSGLSKLEINNDSRGVVTLAANATIEYNFDGKKYIIKNNENIEKTLQYTNSGSTVSLKGSGVTVTAENGQDDYLKITGNNNTIITQDGNDNVQIAGDNNTVLLGDGDDIVNLVKGDHNTFDGGDGYDVFICGGTNSVYSHFNLKHDIADPFNLQIGANSDEDSRISVSLGFTIPIIDLDISTPDNALDVINEVDDVMNTIMSKISEIGALKNRLDSVYQSNITKIENYTAAKSTIMDADIAEESAIFVKNQILQQTSSALLSQSQNLHSSLLMMLTRK